VESAGQLSIKIKERESRLKLKIELALEKIADGTFGVCENCGEDISIERLMVRPVTTLCIHCKQDQEDKERFKKRQYRSYR
jgi:DnaK suppressor protein